MTSLFSKPKVDKSAQDAQLRAQRQQEQTIQQQTAEQAMELGTRKRLSNARASGRNSLFSQSGAAGVQQETLG